MISILFYLISIFFIWSEIYHVYHKNRLDVNFRNKDISLVTKLDLVFYFCRLTFFIWIFLGLWSSQQNLFILLILLNLIKFPFYHFNKRLFAIWDNVLPTINIIQIIIIMIYGFLS